MQSGQRAKFDSIRRVLGSAFTGTFQDLGTSLTVVPRIIIFQNDTNGTVEITDDISSTGIALELIAGERLVLDLATNRNDRDNTYGWGIGTQFSVSGTAASTGSVKISIIYAVGI
jgi:hypothetical protein